MGFLGMVSLEKVDYIVGTGYGRLKVPFANENISEITCHARGAQWMCPSVKTAVDIDLGAHDIYARTGRRTLFWSTRPFYSKRKTDSALSPLTGLSC